MAIVLLSEMQRQLALTDSAPGDDLVLLQGKIEAAQGHIERLLGFKIEDRFYPEHEKPEDRGDRDPVPPDLIEAVMQLAAFWFEHREASGDGGRPLPFGVAEVVNEHRGWTF